MDGWRGAALFPGTADVSPWDSGGDADAVEAGAGGWDGFITCDGGVMTEPGVG